MKYETPQVRDFGSIADHTYGTGDCFDCASGPICVKTVTG
jgi:hypothetical protein